MVSCFSSVRLKKTGAQRGREMFFKIGGQVLRLSNSEGRYFVFQKVMAGTSRVQTNAE